MKKLTLLFSAVLISISAFSQSYKYSFSIEGVEDAVRGKEVMGDYVHPFFNSGGNSLVRFKFYVDTKTYKVETKQQVSEESLSDYFNDKGLTVLSFKEEE
ncbi:hypothetical protein H9Y05_05990 [Crocinitomicaceae bacterium CZZ-1]|uniref:Uncharacterized protein n=1 Tax=Taishania pollutisoli TaxID=2766479 RepID=A0A8J6TX58_9FLAO|nr:hypothetical protein [Taishania pollutisoli]MBC9812026.1 hypothetical protein [Taishania pollutisoli]MBX2949898.1 hypothetical protein [Crocinitomicaceae bacterium]NGF74817.1 hypothetical protein [Fluviicola sp. SGL-29]